MIEEKLKRLLKIWAYYIIDEKYFHSKVKLPEELESNYCSKIIGYFGDTLDIVFSPTEPIGHNQVFSRNISLLQAMYVQQDFIEELLLIFKCGVTKGDFKKDLNYDLNRDIRNELIGHPVRRTRNNDLISSTLFSYQGGQNHIEYLRSHKKTNFRAEVIKHNISDIQQRHKDFTNTYLDKVLNKSKTLLNKYIKELGNLERVIKQNDFNAIVDAAGHIYKSIFKSSYAYDPESLKYIYERKTKHLRYQLFIEQFCLDIKSSVEDTKRDILELFEPKKAIPQSSVVVVTNVASKDYSKTAVEKLERKPSYGYDIGKLATNRTTGNFDMYAGMLEATCPKNEDVFAELDHMKQNQDNEAEYHAALCLLESLLKRN